MSWNSIIQRVHDEVSFRLGNRAHKQTQNNVIALKINMLVNDDGIPLVWTVESKHIEPKHAAREMLGLINSVDISREI